jgi:hypothetical protein
VSASGGKEKGTRERGGKESEQEDLQNANAPEMIPFATAAGKSLCASAVKGACSAPKSVGGITRRRLRVRVSLPSPNKDWTRGVFNAPVHG